MLINNVPDAVQSYKKGDSTIEIFMDKDPMDPRADFDQFGTMVCSHKRYTLGDKHDYRTEDFRSWEEVEAQIWKDTGGALILPLYMYDHSGITISTSYTYPYNDRWDAGQLGFIYVSYADIRKEYGVKRISSKIMERARQMLLNEVETYDNYLCGEVYGYVITDKDDNEESCWGFFGLESCKEAAEEAAA
jgi:hypothetical protein